MSAGTVDVRSVLEQALAREGEAEQATVAQQAALAAFDELVAAAARLLSRASRDRAGLLTVYSSDTTRLAAAIRGAGGAA